MATPNTGQHTWRFQNNDNASVNSCSFKGLQGSLTETIALDTPFIIRIARWNDATANFSGTHKLQARYNGGSWFDVTTTSSYVRIYDGLPTDAEACSQLLTSYSTYSFDADGSYDDGNGVVTSVPHAKTVFWEDAWCITLRSAEMSATDYVEFRSVPDNGTTTTESSFAKITASAGSQNIGVGVSAGSFDCVTLSSVLGAFSKSASQAIGKFQGISLTLSTSISKGLLQVVEHWYSQDVTLYQSGPATFANPVVGKFSAITQTIQTGGISTSVPIVVGKYQGVSTGFTLGSISPLVSQATIKLFGITTTPGQAGQDIGLSPSVGIWSSIPLTLVRLSPIELYDSTWIPFGGADTTPQLIPPAGMDNGDYSTGRIEDTDNPTDVIGAKVDGWSSVEWAFRVRNPASAKTYELAIFRNGVQVPWIVTPELIVGAGNQFIALTPAIADWLVNTLGKSFSGTSAVVQPSTMTIQAESLTELIGQLVKALSAAIVSWIGVTPSTFGTQYIPVTASGGAWDSNTATPSLGSIQQMVTVALTELTAGQSDVFAGALAQAISVASSKLLAVDLTAQFDSTNVQVYVADVFLNALSAAILHGTLNEPVSSADGVWLSEQLTPVISGSISKSVLPAEAFLYGSDILAYVTKLIVAAAVRAAYDKALSKVRAKGVPFLFHGTKQGTHYPLTGIFTAPTDVLINGFAVEITKDAQVYEKLQLSQETTITLLFVPNIIGLSPELGYTASYAGTTRTVSHIKRYEPDGNVIACEVYLSSPDTDNIDSSDLNLYEAEYHTAVSKLREKGVATSFVHSDISDIDGFSIEIPGDPTQYENLELVEDAATTLLFAADVKGVRPLLGSFVIWSGTLRTVASVLPIRPAELTIISKVVLRGADTTNIDSGGEDTYYGKYQRLVQKVREYGIETIFTHATVANVVGTSVQLPDELEEYEKLELQSNSPVTLFFVPETPGTRPVLNSIIEWSGRKRYVYKVTPIRPAGTTIAAKVIVL